MKNVDHNKLLSCSVQRGIEILKKTGNHSFEPVLFLQAINKTLENVGDQLHEKTVYNIEKLYSEVMYQYGAICNTPSSQTFVYGKNQCDSPLYIPQSLNRGPVIMDPPTIILDDL